MPPSPNRQKWMIAISTAQSQINYIPFVKYGLDSMLLVQTPDAIKKQWSKGLKKLLGEKCATLDLIVEEENDVLVIVDKINAELQNTCYTGAEIWINLGGGQKHHSIALWQVFAGRQIPGDMAVYADQTSGRILRWYHDGQGKLLNDTTDRFEVKLTLSNILTLYDKRQKESDTTQEFKPGTVFLEAEFKEKWREDGVIRWILEAYGLPSKEQEDLQYFQLNGLSEESRGAWINHQFKLIRANSTIVDEYIFSRVKDRPFNRNIVGEIRSKVLEQFNSLVLYGKLTKSLFDSGMAGNIGAGQAVSDENRSMQEMVKRFGRKSSFFEKLVQQVFQDLLSGLRGRHILCEAYSNFCVTSSEDPTTQEAEYDLLFCTSRGRLYAIDAKTLDFDKKDADARLYVMQQAAGVYTRFIVVLPYFKTEPYHSLMRKSLRDLPFMLTKLRIPFYVLSEDDQEFNVYRHKEQTYRHVPQEEPFEKVTCIPFQRFFEKEGLIAPVPDRAQGTTLGR